MIEIVLHAGGRLDLPENFVLNIIHENPLFLEDRIPAPYTVQFEVPSTANNLQLLGMPNRIASSGLKKRLAADLIHFGFIISRGELLLTGFDNYPKLQFVGTIAIEAMSKNLNQLELGDYDYGSFPLIANNIDYAEAWATDYKNAMTTAATTGEPFAVAPIYIKGSDWEGDAVINGAKNALRQYINFYNPLEHADHKFFLLDPIYEPLTRAHIPILPMPYLNSILVAVFGDKLTNNPFGSGDFAKLVLPTFNHKYFSYDNLLGYYWDHELNPVMFFNPLVDDYNWNGTDWRDLSIHIKSFQQSYPFLSLLKNILKMFSMTLFTGRTYSIEKNDDIMNRNVIVEWDDKIAGVPIKSYDLAKDYVFSYGEISSVITTNVTQLSNLNAIYERMITTEENIDCVLQDLSTGGIYKLNKVIVPNDVYDQPIIRSEVQQSPISVYYEESEREKYEVTTEIKPLDVNIHVCWGDDNPNLKHHWAVPEMDLKDIKSAPCIMFYGGLNDAFNNVGSYPQLMAHNFTQFGRKLFDFSLLPSGTDGLLNTFHSKFKQWVEKDKLRLKASVRLTPAELRALNFRDKYYVGGRLFYIEKIEYSLTHSGVSLVEGDLIEC